jgi:hypothetical protein
MSIRLRRFDGNFGRPRNGRCGESRSYRDLEPASAVVMTLPLVAAGASKRCSFVGGQSRGSPFASQQRTVASDCTGSLVCGQLHCNMIVEQVTSRCLGSASSCRSPPPLIFGLADIRCDPGRGIGGEPVDVRSRSLSAGVAVAGTEVTESPLSPSSRRYPDRYRSKHE